MLVKINSHNNYYTITEQQQGFTLVEMIVAVAIFSLIVGTFSTMFVYFFRSYNFSIEQGQSLDEAKLAMTKLSAELREARASEVGAYALVTANDTELAFYADVDNDDRVERVRYVLQNGNLIRGVIEPGSPPLVYDNNNEITTVISEFVRNDTRPLFYYYNSDWPGDTINNPLILAQRLLDTRVIRVELFINTNTGIQTDLHLTSQVMLRNLKTN